MIHIVGPNILLGTIILYLICKLMGIIVCTSYNTNSFAFFKEYCKNRFLHTLVVWWGIYCMYYPPIWLKIQILHPKYFMDLKVGCNNFDQRYILSTGIDTNLFQYSENFIKNKLIYIGRITSEKNLFRLIDLFTLIQDEYTLDIVGFGPTVEDALKFAQAFICTSLNESYGFTLLESLSCGTPIIYPKCPVFEQLYKTYFSQLEYDLDNDNEFINALKYIKQDDKNL
ncbi:unnamed protein product [Rotaria sordida]|uniref:Glycosyl transferase family 1 domain-containing protein n=1 Tax=Rotaria sordida TaxID=392033 RepID=A0A818NWT2_9BILA|nr:unnamed protein product [Rotaria sordida]CAF3614006.1 unnamed protein product [Rotaria sordida]